jgi:uncharacterized protein YeaO (DUF488 family)
MSDAASDHAITIHTGRLFRYRGADALDISRKGGHPLGVLFAPSWKLLMPFKESAWDRERRWKRELTNPDERDRAAFLLAIENEAAQEWSQYVEKFTEEMKVSYREHRSAWHAALHLGPEVTVCCFCEDAARCHRSLVASMFLAAGPKNNATVTLGGERPQPNRKIKS